MALSYTTALDRDVRGLAVASARPTFGHLLLPITSVVALLRSVWRMRGVPDRRPRWPAGTAAPVNLNTVTEVQARSNASSTRDSRTTQTASSRRGRC